MLFARNINPGSCREYLRSESGMGVSMIRHRPRPPNVALLRALWSRLDGISQRVRVFNNQVLGKVPHI